MDREGTYCNASARWSWDVLGRGDVDAVMRRTRDDPAYLTSRDLDGNTPLVIAIEFNDPLLVEFMLRQGADPNVSVDDGNTALLIAIESKKPESVEIVSRLIAAGADFHRPYHRPPLHLAATRGHLEKVRHLLEAGADVNQRKSIDAGETPLMEAAHMGRPAVARLLFDFGADPHMRDTINDRTPLEIAQYSAKGADPNVIDMLERFSTEVTGCPDWSSERRAMFGYMIFPSGIGERYREASNQIAREGEFDEVIRVLAEYERR
jgi:uncharacterized protein